MTDNPHLAQIEQRFWPKAGSHDIWAIVDAARDRRILGMLRNSPTQYSCMYTGPIPRDLEKVAPYLIQLEHRNPHSQELIQNAWGNSWGVFLKCRGSLDAVRRHFRQFLSVRDASGRLLVFRYYDPRVFRVYLPTCRSDELRTVFGPTECFWVEHEHPHTMVEFRFDDIGLLRKELSVAAPES
jgi:hypothetical protein